MLANMKNSELKEAFSILENELSLSEQSIEHGFEVEK